MRQVFLVLMALSIVSCVPHANPYGATSSTTSDVERIELCAKYQTQTGWSEGYSIEAQVMSGNILNSRTESYSYNVYSTYAVIFWSNEQASVIELQNFYGSFHAYGTNGTDQEGRTWQLSKTSYCY